MSSQLQWGDDSDGESASRDGRGQPLRSRRQQGGRTSFGDVEDDASFGYGSSEDEEDDEDEEEDSSSEVRLRALDFDAFEMDEATELLIGDRQGEDSLRNLTVEVGVPPEMDESEDEEEEPHARALVFRQFVDAVESHRRIQKLFLKDGNFRLEGAFPSLAYVAHSHGQGRADDADSHLPGDADLERFFRSVLPNHPSLTKITLSECWILPRYIRVFMNSIACSPGRLSSLTLDELPLTSVGYRAIEDTLRQNAKIEKLVVSGCRANERSWHRVCRGAATNRHLQELELLEEDITVQPNTLLPVVRPESTLKRLTVCGYWAVEAFNEFVAELRTNAVLERLVLIKAQETENDDDETLLLKELLHSYNFALTHVELRWWDDARPEERFTALLRRNARVRRAHEALAARRYHVEQSALWPTVFQTLATFPTLLYRFVRQGNVDAFSDQVLSLTRTRTTK